jgi:hypothetical protein
MYDLTSTEPLYIHPHRPRVTHLLEQVFDLLLLSLNVLLEGVELLAHDPVLTLEPQGRLTLTLQVHAWIDKCICVQHAACTCAQQQL